MDSNSQLLDRISNCQPYNLLRDNIKVLFSNLENETDSKKAFKLTKTVLNQKYELLNSFERVKLFFILSNTLYFMKEDQESESYALRAIELLKHEKNFENVKLSEINYLYSLLYKLLAKINNRKGAIFDSLTYYGLTYEKLLFLPDNNLENTILNNIGAIYFSIQSFDKALEMFCLSENFINQSMKKGIKFPKQNIVSSKINIALASIALGNIEKSEKYLKKALKYTLDPDQPYLLFLNSLIENHKKNYIKSDIYFEKAFNSLIEKKDYNKLSEMYYIYSMFFFKRKDFNLDFFINLNKKGSKYFNLCTIFHIKTALAFINLKLSILLKDKSYFKNSFNDYQKKLRKNYSMYLEEEASCVYEQYISSSLEKQCKEISEQKVLAEYNKNDSNIKKYKAKKQYEKMLFINKIAKTSRSSNNFNKNIKNTFDILQKRVPFDTAFLCIKNLKSHNLNYISFKKNDFTKFQKLKNKKLLEFFKPCMKIKESKEWVLSKGIMITTPIQYSNKNIAVFAVYSNEITKYSAEEIEILKTVSIQLTIPIKQFLRKNLIETINTEKDNIKQEIENINTKINGKVYIDGLTGYPNKRDFDSKLLFLIRKIVNIKTKLALIFVKIDDFYQYSDLYGHKKADETIKKIANTLYSVGNEIKNRELLFSCYEDDSFVFAFPQKNENINELSNQIRQKIEDMKIKNKSSELNFISVRVLSSIYNSSNISDFVDFVSFSYDFFNDTKYEKKNSVYVNNFDK